MGSYWGAPSLQASRLAHPTRGPPSPPQPQPGDPGNAGLPGRGVGRPSPPAAGGREQKVASLPGRLAGGPNQPRGQRRDPASPGRPGGLPASAGQPRSVHSPVAGIRSDAPRNGRSQGRGGGRSFVGYARAARRPTPSSQPARPGLRRGARPRRPAGDPRRRRECRAAEPGKPPPPPPPPRPAALTWARQPGAPPAQQREEARRGEARRAGQALLPARPFASLALPGPGRETPRRQRGSEAADAPRSSPRWEAGRVGGGGRTEGRPFLGDATKGRIAAEKDRRMSPLFSVPPATAAPLGRPVCGPLFPSSLESGLAHPAAREPLLGTPPTPPRGAGHSGWQRRAAPPPPAQGPLRASPLKERATERAAGGAPAGPGHQDGGLGRVALLDLL